ncbi:MAG: AAA family ATPase [Bacteroidia bacterium]|nr:AAA family ATPase [Bacteroidia bacterium]
MNKNAIIFLRGLPGSGKTSLALRLSENGKYPIHSVDDYFIDKQTNEYTFDHLKNHLAYSACEAKTRQSMIDGYEKVFLDNTFTMEWEMEPYFHLAKEFDYDVFVLTVENWHGGKNRHQISEEQLQKMAAKYKVKLLP